MLLAFFLAALIKAKIHKNNVVFNLNLRYRAQIHAHKSGKVIWSKTSVESHLKFVKLNALKGIASQHKQHQRVFAWV